MTKSKCKGVPGLKRQNLAQEAFQVKSQTKSLKFSSLASDTGPNFKNFDEKEAAKIQKLD